MSDRRSIEAVESVLGKPVAAEYPDNAQKIRRNLLVCSITGIVVSLGSVRIDPTSTIFGLTLQGLDDDLLRLGLAAVTIYFLLHFFWHVCDAVTEWRLRVTGTRLAFVTTGIGASEHGDYPNDPRQSTLYSWWVDQARRIGNLRKLIEVVEKMRSDSEAAVRSLAADSPAQTNLNNVLKSLTQLQLAVSDLKRSVEHARETLESQRIPTSLKRFDKWFSFFLRSQNLRWILIETLIPLIAGSVAVYLLCRLV